MFWSKTNIPSLVSILLLIIVVFLVYADTLRYEFVWDDEDLIQRNPRITRLSSFSTFFEIEPFYCNFYYRPLVILSLAFDYRLWELKPFGYHLSNLIFHLGSVLLIYFISLSLLPRLSSFLVALLFGLHPIHTEAVAWISGRSDVLCSFFFLASVLCFIHFVQIESGRKRRGLYLLSLVFFFCSLLAKEMAVTLPLILLAWWIFSADEVSLRQRKWKEIFSLLVPFVLLLFIFMFWRRTILGHWGYSDAKIDFFFLGFETTFWIIFKYAQLLFLPLKLNAVYDITPGSKGLNIVAFLSLGLVVLILILVFLYSDKKKQKVIVFGLCWLLLTLLPVSNFIQTASIFMAERYLYLPSLGYCLIFGWLSGGLLTKKILPSRFILRMSLIMVLAGLTVFYAVRTIQRNRDWKDNFSLGKSLLEVNPNSATGHHYLGMKYAKEGDNEKAKKEYLMVLKVAPNMRGTHYNLGIIYFQEGKIGLAKEEFKKETEIDSLYAEAYYNLGTAYSDLGQLDSSIQAFQKAVDINPDLLFALENLASLYEARGLFVKALPLWERALKLERDSVWIAQIRERIKNIKALLRYPP
jgi:tetratricopeptide (TPR) repeat protein